MAKVVEEKLGRPVSWQFLVFFLFLAVFFFFWRCSFYLFFKCFLEH